MHVNTFIFHRLHLTSCVCDHTAEYMSNHCGVLPTPWTHMFLCRCTNARTHALVHKAHKQLCSHVSSMQKRAQPPAAPRWGLTVQQGTNTPFKCQAENKQLWRCTLLPKHWLEFAPCLLYWCLDLRSQTNENHILKKKCIAKRWSV